MFKKAYEIASQYRHPANIKNGASLCKLGYPFHNFKTE